MGSSSSAIASRSSRSSEARRIRDARERIAGRRRSARYAYRPPAEIGARRARPRGRRDRLERGLSLLVVGEDLQLDRQVHPADRDVRPAASPGPARSSGSTAGPPRPSGRPPAAPPAPGVQITPIATSCSRTISGRSSRCRTSRLADALADRPGVHVQDRDHPEAAFLESAVVGQGVAEVPGAGDEDGPVLGEPQLAPDLMQQVGDVVARRPGSRTSPGRRGPCGPWPSSPRPPRRGSRRRWSSRPARRSRPAPADRGEGARRWPRARGAGSRREPRSPQNRPVPPKRAFTGG